MNTFYVANIILQHFIDKAEPIRNMKLQKLLYFSCGWFAGYYRKKYNADWLIEDEFYAWPYGPVCPTLYHEVSCWGSDPIEDEINTENIIENNQERHKNEKENMIKDVIKEYGYLSDWELSDITHKANTPWTKTIDTHHIGSRITKRIITDHYHNMIEGATRAMIKYKKSKETDKKNKGTRGQCSYNRTSPKV